MHIIPNLVHKSQFIAVFSLLLTLGVIAYIITRPTATLPPDTYINSLNVGRLTPQEAKQAVALAIRDYRSQWPNTFTHATSEIPVSLDAEAVRYHVDETVDSLGARNYILYHLPLINRPTQITLLADVNQAWLASQSAAIAERIDQPAIATHITVSNTASGSAVQIVAGKDGFHFDQKAWEESIFTHLVSLTLPTTQLTTTPVYQAATPQQINDAYHAAQTLLSRELHLKLQVENQTDKQWTIPGKDLVGFISVTTKYDEPAIKAYLDGLAQNINQPPKDAKFQFDETIGKVKEFSPAEKGLQVNIDQSTQQIKTVMDQLLVDPIQNTAFISVQTTEPVVQLSEVNRLGIKERIGIGQSTFKGSIASRVHNVILGASRLNGTLIKPGEEFSFNQSVGDISAATGYQQAYIIQNGRTVLGDGGGICQDSTTVFRAALNAGLPITVRKGHAYRVGYYEQDTKAGIDATVYSPSTDLKFLNDTPAHILIQTYVDEPKRELTVVFYGTSDGRSTKITDHQVWGITPPLPDVWIDDPTLATGVVKQVDWKAAGAKAKFTQVVERNGQVLFEKTFYTTYQPWASVFMRGTKQ